MPADQHWEKCARPRKRFIFANELGNPMNLEALVPDVEGQVVAWAASNGDRSENADYLYGKRRLNQIDSRIRFLTKRIDAAVVVDPAARRPDSVATPVLQTAGLQVALR